MSVVNEKSQRYHNVPNAITRRKFRVKIKSLAEEARIIRAEERKIKGSSAELNEIRGCLQAHRMGRVREEQRHTLLAYAYWRGKPRHELESSADTLPLPGAIVRILKSLAWDFRTTSSDISDWTLGR